MSRLDIDGEIAEHRKHSSRRCWRSIVVSPPKKTLALPEESRLTGDCSVIRV